MDRNAEWNQQQTNRFHIQGKAEPRCVADIKQEEVRYNGVSAETDLFIPFQERGRTRQRGVEGRKKRDTGGGDGVAAEKGRR